MTTMSDVHQLMKNVAYWKDRAEQAERERDAALQELDDVLFLLRSADPNFALEDDYQQKLLRGHS